MSTHWDLAKSSSGEEKEGVGEVRVCQGPCVCKGPPVGETGVWEWGKPYPLMLPGPPVTLSPFQGLVPSLALRLVHGLVHRLLNATFEGYNLTLHTRTVQMLAFKLGCDFAGLSLDSDAMDRAPQVRGGQDMVSGVGGRWPGPPLQKSSRGVRSERSPGSIPRGSVLVAEWPFL